MPETRPPSGSGPRSGDLGLHLLPVAIIAAAVFAVYGNSLAVPFLYDDQINIAANPYIRMTELSLSQVRRAVVQDGFQLRPLSNLSFAFDYYFHGLNLTMMHLENISLHAATAGCLYFLILTLAAGSGAGPKTKVAAALAGSLMWALHPAQTQAVVYLVQRQTALAGLGSVAAVLFYLRARQGRGRAKMVYFGLAAAAALLGAGSKETGLLIPGYWLLLEITALARDRTAAANRRAAGTMAAVLAGAGIMAGLIVFRAGVLAHYLAEYKTLSYGPVGRVLTEARVVTSYLVTMFFPHPARLCLEHQVAASSSLLHPATTLPAAALLVAALAGGAALVRRRPLTAFLVLGFFLALLPESTVIPIDLAADHRIYLYSLFVLPAAGAAAALLVPPKKSLPLIIAALALTGALTAGRNRTWDSARSLWRDAAFKSPGLARPWSNYCSALIESRAFGSALAACERAVALDPDLDMAAQNQAVALSALGRDREAEALFLRTAEAHPDNAVAQYNYARLRERAGDGVTALGYYRRALQADAFHYEARVRLGVLLAEAGDLEGARSELETATRLFPEPGPGWLALAIVLEYEGLAAEAGAARDGGRGKSMPREWETRLSEFSRRLSARRGPGP